MRRPLGLLLFFLVCCGSHENAAPANAVPPPPSEAPKTTAAAAPDDIWTRVGADLTACYEAGLRSVPEMKDGRITFHATVDRSGKTTCVVPSDDIGLTQDVEDCMRTRIRRETFKATAADWSTAIPVVLRSGSLSLGRVTESPSIEMIDSRGLTEELYDVVDGLLPATKECLATSATPAERKVVVVGAEVGKDGAVTCAVASSTSAIPADTRHCVANVFTKARFRPPKRGIGLLSVPIEVTKRR